MVAVFQILPIAPLTMAVAQAAVAVGQAAAVVAAVADQAVVAITVVAREYKY